MFSTIHTMLTKENVNEFSPTAQETSQINYSFYVVSSSSYYDRDPNATFISVSGDAAEALERPLLTPLPQADAASETATTAAGEAGAADLTTETV